MNKKEVDNWYFSQELLNSAIDILKKSDNEMKYKYFEWKKASK